MKWRLRKCRAVRYKGFIMEPSVQGFLVGRILRLEELSFLGARYAIYKRLGYVEEIESIELRGGKYRCNRCLNEDEEMFVAFQCARCERTCVYCRHCIRMGRVCTCSKLVKWSGSNVRVAERVVFQWDGMYSDAQQQAANEVVESVRLGRLHLIFAVCGSGKTEILFAAVREALSRKKRVCIATPRTDVVLELYPRLQKVFPNTTIHALYGGADVKREYASLVIATTHQLYRFENAFDVMIVDEADAFPYTYDETLQQAVQKAKKCDAPIVFVTATPSRELLSFAKKEEGISFMSRRYHGHPLPVPHFRSLWQYEKKIKKGVIPKKLAQWTSERLAREEPFFIFFPTVALMERALPLFQQLAPNIESVHAEDEMRKEKVLSFRRGEFAGLLTTTILERGVTIPNVQVAVVGAESAIFTKSALIQIAGRVGRNAAFPNGEVVFFHDGITQQMDFARAEILALNEGKMPI